MAAVTSTSSPSVIAYHHGWKSSGRALRTISCERCFSVGHCSQTFNLFCFSPPPPYPPPPSCCSPALGCDETDFQVWQTQERSGSLLSTLPRKTGFQEDGDILLLQRVGWLCVLRAALSATHTHLHDNPHPAPQKLHDNHTQLRYNPHLRHTLDELEPAGPVAVDAMWIHRR